MGFVIGRYIVFSMSVFALGKRKRDEKMNWRVRLWAPK